MAGEGEETGQRYGETRRPAEKTTINLQYREKPIYLIQFNNRRSMGGINNENSILEMLKRKTIFIGCGDGREIMPLAKDRENLLIGLEPIEELYMKAVEALSPFPNVLIVK